MSKQPATKSPTVSDSNSTDIPLAVGMMHPISQELWMKEHAARQARIAAQPRPLSAIARDIKRNWPNINYAAHPYVNAMASLDRISDNFYADSGRSVVLYFLSNASTWRGEYAKSIKAELKAMLRADGYPIK